MCQARPAAPSHVSDLLFTTALVLVAITNQTITKRLDVEGTSGVHLMPHLIPPAFQADQTDLSTPPDSTSVCEAAPLSSLGQGGHLGGDMTLQGRRKEASELSLEYFYFFLSLQMQ